MKEPLVGLLVLVIASPLFIVSQSRANQNGFAQASSTGTATPTFADEFDGAASTLPDSSKWYFEIGGDGWGNQEREYYTDSPDVAAMDGSGHLAVSAHKPTGNQSQYRCWYGTPCDYVSARLLTLGRFSQAYGHFEARMKMPGVKGSWPAFWMLGTDIRTVDWPACGELDIVENFGGPGPLYIEGSAHGPSGNKYKTAFGAYNYPQSGTGVQDWHTYALDWTSASLSYSVDGSVYRTIPRREMGSAWVFDKSFFMILNLAVGGTGGGSITGAPSSMQMLVDYVRVYSSTTALNGTPARQLRSPTIALGTSIG